MLCIVSQNDWSFGWTDDSFVRATYDMSYCCPDCVHCDVFQVYRVPVKKGDVVLLASDGLFDNLFQNEIVAIMNSVLNEGSGPEVNATVLFLICTLSVVEWHLGLQQVKIPIFPVNKPVKQVTRKNVVHMNWTTVIAALFECNQQTSLNKTYHQS